MDAAFRFLSFRPRSEAEVRRRLTRRFPAELVDRVVQALRNKKYLDDEEFARRWRLNRERFHPRGRRLLQRELSRFGVARGVIDQALLGLEEEENAYQAGLKLAIRLISKDCTQEDLSRKLYPYLQRRGFGYSLARDTVDRLWLELAPQPLDGEINSGARS
jgi:regulatory protein